MKNKTSILIAVLILSALLFGGCTKTPAVDMPAAPEKSEPSPAPAESETSLQRPPINCRTNEKGMIKVINGDEVILPVEHDVPGDELISYAGLVKEGVKLDEYLPGIYEELPAVDRAKGFALDVYEWGCIYMIDVFDASFTRLAHVASAAELYSFAAEHYEELIIDVRIFVPGCDIFEEPTERSGLGYAFKLSAADREADAAEPFMRLYSYGMEVPTKAFFFHKASAFYEDGVPVGLLQGDGIAFFDPDHIASAYDDLPGYSLCRTEGLDIRLSEGSKISYIYIYDPANGFERTMLFSKAELDRFIIDSAADNKEYVVEVIVSHTGDYIEALDKNESETNSYAFIVR